MSVHTHRYEVATRGQGDAHDITREVAGALKRSGLSAGILTVWVVGSTAAVTSIEFESGAIADFNAMLEVLAPRHGEYQHHLRWHDDNGSSHVRAALLGPSLTVPFVNGELILGTWQQVMMIELDTRSRKREVIVQVVGERS